MPIRNRDGSYYSLTKPNPLVKTQEWDKEGDLILHNMEWEAVVVENDERKPPENAFQKQVDKFADKPAPVEKPVIKKREKLEPLEPPLPVEAPKVEVPKEVPVEQPKEQRDIKNVVIFHCQPAIVRQRGDEFYGEAYSTIQYGKKFTFEGVIVAREDLEMQFWTVVEIGKGSVVFASHYRAGEKFSEFRWWKVETITPKSGGFLIAAVTSDYQPDFSD